MPRKTQPGWEDIVLPIFAQPEPEPLRNQTRKEVEDNAKISWRRYKSARRILCDHCTDAHHKGETPSIMDASWMRVIGNVTVYLCYRHTAEARHRDQLDGRQ